MSKKLVILGATGSVGAQALEVAAGLGYPVRALAARRDAAGLEAQVRRFRPVYAALEDETAAAELRVRLADTPTRVLAGSAGVCELAALEDADTVLNAIVGVAGLLPTLAAIGAGHDVALANKETLVTGGALVTRAAAEAGVRLLPVDSEHSAIFQCLQGRDGAAEKVILTASGGPFWEWDAARMADATASDALRHPTWRMGAKITVDSASMMNKGLELIEACHLFGLPPGRVDVVIHRESIVHSLVEFADGAQLAQLGLPDMRLPIQYALTYPGRQPLPGKRLRLAEVGRLTFAPPDDARFPCLPLCREAMTRGGLYPAALNGANEAAVARFLAGDIRFGRLAELAASALDTAWDGALSAENVLRVDREMRERLTIQH